jgi:hypothetical protein
MLPMQRAKALLLQLPLAQMWRGRQAKKKALEK